MSNPARGRERSAKVKQRSGHVRSEREIGACLT